MDEHSEQQPLLNQVTSLPKTSSLASFTKWILKLIMWVIFVTWVAIIFLYPTSFFSGWYHKWIQATKGTLFGTTGSVFLTFSAPLLAIAVLSAVYLVLSGEDETFRKKKGNEKARWRLWTFPVLVEGPFEVVTAAELIGILLFVVYVLWAVYNYTLRLLAEPSFQYLPLKERSAWMLEMFGLRLGSIGQFCLAFLFVPVSRGSVLLRFIDIPFEHATRYHVWLGHLTMLIFTLHGLAYVVGWSIQGRCLQELVEWKDVGIANLPGVISLVAGLFMWITSLPKLRTRNFELFFYTHQLYLIFILFLALHVGDFIFSIAAAGIFLFMLDRFLRFCQSRTTVDIISAKALPSGCVELVISKPKSLRYNALSFIFLQVRELSWLEWHPFSVSSSPLEGNDRIAILIKVLGKWTHKLKQTILNEKEEDKQPHSSITASVEGPYGHESPYYLMYENLILVAGGIGMSPFLAILSDIVQRCREGKTCLAKNILVVWAVKKSDELSLLSTLNLESTFSHNLNIQISIFVTRESAPPLEDVTHCSKETTFCPLSKGVSMSVLVGTGHNVWSGIYVISSTIGFVILVALLDMFYINPFHIKIWWLKGLLFLASMAASVLLFGGVVIWLWSSWEKHISKSKGTRVFNANDIEVGEERPKISDNGISSKDSSVNGFTSTLVQYGSRPNFEEIFESVGEKWGKVDIGVIICGPSTLQSSVAKTIRSHNVGRRSHHSIFHFHSHSFDL